MDGIDHLSAIDEIGEVVALRARGGDRFDMALVSECHDLDGPDHHGAFVGNFREFIERLTDMEQSGATLCKFHTVANSLVDVDAAGGTAFAETYHIADELHMKAGAPVHYRIGGRYLDSFRREAGRWIIAERRVVYDWSRSMAATRPFWDLMRYQRHLRGERSDADPLYEGRPQLRGARPDRLVFDSISGQMMTLQRLQELGDRQAITDVLHARARASDRGDVALAHACYHDGATERHGDIVGSAAEVIDKGLTTARPEDGVAHMFHTLSNILIQFESASTAFVESYHVCYGEVRSPDGPPLDHAIGGRYLDRFECREGRWAIAHRDVVFDWSRQDPVTAKFWDLYPGAPFLFGVRGGDDPLYDHVPRGGQDRAMALQA